MNKQAIDALLKTFDDAAEKPGNPRVRAIVNRIVKDICYTIEDFDVQPSEFWTALNYLNEAGREFGLIAAGLGLERFLDVRMDEAEEKAGIQGGTPRTIEGPLYVAGAPVRDGVSKIDLDADDGAGPLVIHGTVTGLDGKPVAGALVECWHANSHGFYSHFDPTGKQSDFNLRGAVRTGADGRYEFRTLMPVGYGCPPQGATQQLLNGLGRHGNRPAHVHFFVDSHDHRKLTTQFNIEGDPLIWDDFAYATREELIPPVVDKTGGTALGLKADAYQDIEFNFVLTPRVEGKDNQIVERLRASATA